MNQAQKGREQQCQTLCEPHNPTRYVMTATCSQQAPTSPHFSEQWQLLCQSVLV